MKSLKGIIQKLLAKQSLNSEEASEVMRSIASGNVPSSQIAAFITVYMMRPIHVYELEGFRNALLDLALEVPLEFENATDMCGTGGDGKNSFNISTLASIVVAGAGYKVVKHGNYGVSSVCGSSNVLEFLGYQFTQSINTLQDQLNATNICFLHAPLFHPALASVGPIRKELGMKTFFNMLGPLVNPARPTHQFVGVFSQELSRLYKYLFQASDLKNYTVVYAMDGYDEISLTGKYFLSSRKEEKLVSPEEMGFARVQPNQIFGGDTIDSAAEIFMQILKAKGTEAQHEVVIANAASSIQCLEPNLDFEVCVSEARESLLEGKGLKIIQQLTS